MQTINVGVFVPNWVGDVVMATPTLRALHEHYRGRARLIGIMRPYISDVLAGTSWLDTTIKYDRHSRDPDVRAWAVIRQLRQLRLDSVILMTNSLSSAWIAACGRVPQRIGYARYGRGRLLTERLKLRRSGLRITPVSAVDYYLELATVIGAHWESRQLELGTTTRDERLAKDVWTRFGLRPNDSVVALNAGAAYGSAKDWPTEHFAALAQRLAAHQGQKVVVVCGPNERASAARIVELAGCQGVYSLADEKVGLGLSKSIIKRCQLLVSTDSGPRHFGAAFQIPTITLFGPTDPRWSHNYNSRSIDLQRHVPCGPCAKRRCPLKHHRCMETLSVDQAYRAALQLLPTKADHRVA